MSRGRDEDFGRIAGLENPVEAQLLHSILSEEGIPHRIRSFHDTAYDGLFQVQRGWGEVQGPASRSEEILGVLKGLRVGQSERVPGGNGEDG